MKRAPVSEESLSPKILATAIAEATDEIREAFRPPPNTLFLHKKQMEVYANKSRFKVVVAGRRWGKSLDLKTPIPTPTGWSTMGQLRDGDQVLDQAGQPCSVVRAYPVQIGRPCFEVEFSDGTKVTADRNHQWSTWTHVERENGRRVKEGGYEVGVRTTGQIAKTLTRGELAGPNHSVLGPFPTGHRFIVAVRPVKSIPVRCITVDSPNSLYLCTQSCIPTHNTQLAKVSLIKFARKRKRLIWYVAPSYRMARQIMWPALVEAIPRSWVRKYHETLLSIHLINGSTIELKGADNPDSLRGVGVHYLVMDEVQDIEPDAWKKVLRPTLASTGGHAMFIGTPKAYNFLYELWKQGKRDDPGAWASWQFPTITSPFIPRHEIEAARADMDEKSFRSEFEASFETMSGRVYYPFDRHVHAARPLVFSPDLPILIGQDFNIDPMSSVIFQRQRNGEIWAVDEICLDNSNTDELCDELERRYWRFIDQITIYPDPAGAYRGHQRGESDLDIFRQRGFKKQKYRKKHPAVADRVNAVNRMLKAADGTIKLYVDPRCKKFIEALEQTLYVPGSREVDKKSGVEHAADAGGYFIEFEYPVRKIEVLGISI